MKKWINQYKSWKHEQRKKWAQRYADLIIMQLEKAQTEWEFNYWLNQGYALDARMIVMHDIYLD
jgi:hypothetical protein